ncbi:hypothetical protein G0U57_005592, partial [Chelydra serpentina]
IFYLKTKSGRMQEKSMSASNTGLMRATHLLELPQEMLTEIIKYLPPAEKSKVRATCSLFKDLIDQPVVWQKSTIVLRRISAFNAEFWDVLQKRKITSVEVKEIGLKQWQKLLRCMPGLLDVTVDSLWSEEILQCLQLLTDLQKLHLKMCSRLSERSVIREVVHFQHLTHLLLCGITLSGSELIRIARLQNLHTLSLHTVQKALPEKALEYVLFHLPKLRELSLSYTLTKERILLCLSLPDRHLIPYSSEERFLDHLSTIHTLTVCYIKDFLLHSVDVFGQVLKNLPNLTELNLIYCKLFGQGQCVTKASYIYTTARMDALRSIHQWLI